MINAAQALLGSAPPVSTVITGGSGCLDHLHEHELGSALVSSGSSLLPIASIVVEILSLFVGVAIIGLFIIIVVANRADPDATGHRPSPCTSSPSRSSLW